MTSMETAESATAALPGDLALIAEVAGLDAALKIAEAFRGSYIYVPGLDGFGRELRNERIREDYGRGLSVRRLSIKYSLTERSIRSVLGSASRGLSAEVLEALDRLKLKL